MKKSENYSLLILNTLIRNPNKWCSVKDLCEITGCERKTVPVSMDRIELSGFGVITENVKNHNMYKFGGIYGF